ncbi:HNH endonuclease [Reyranella sp.]|uniref:HNH endonuclease n=1 Tax=Reyranella sp. TaxID=1929291 RepID=UPI003C7CDBE8
MSEAKSRQNRKRYDRRRRQFVRVCEAQNWRCCYCGTETELGIDGPTCATREEVKARSAGGSRELTNTVMACARCNSTRMAGDAFAFYRGVRVGMSVGGAR